MKDFKRCTKASWLARRKEVGNRRTHEFLHRGSEQRAREVGNMLGGFHREQKTMASYWQTMAATMENRRASFAR